MRSINKIEVFSNGSIIAPCHLFSLGQDIHASSIYFRHINTQMTMLTGTVFAIVLYIYLRRLHCYEKMIHQAELFRHNWCVETEIKEKKLGISEKHRMFDTSLLENHIDDPSDPKAFTPASLTEESILDDEILDLHANDKLIAFPSPMRIRRHNYIILMIAMLIVWLILLVEITLSSTGYNTRHIFSDDSYPFARMLEILKTHKRLFDAKVDMHKCFGSLEDMKSGLSSSVTETLKLFVWERSVAASIVMVCVPTLTMAVLVEFSLQGLFFTNVDHENTSVRGKYYIYIHNVGYKFLLYFFLFAFFWIVALCWEIFVWRADRQLACPDLKYLCAK